MWEQVYITWREPSGSVPIHLNDSRSAAAGRPEECKEEKKSHRENISSQ